MAGYQTPFQRWMPPILAGRLGVNPGAGAAGVGNSSPSPSGNPYNSPAVNPPVETPAPATPGQFNMSPSDKLRFNAQYAGMYRNLDTQQAQTQADRSSYLNRLTSDYDTTMAESERNQALARRLLQARMADQGILRSGINVGEQGELGEEYLRHIDSLNRARTGGVEDVESSTARALSQLNMQREQLMFNQARDEETRMREDAMAQAQAEAQQAALQRLQASQPKPTPTGQLVRPSNNGTTSAVEDLFNRMGVPVEYQNGAGNGESAADRLSRITNELENGRSWESLVNSLRMQGGRL